MKATVVGYLPCDFQDKEGKQVQGVSLKVIVDSSRKGFVGKDIMKVWMPKDMVEELGVPAPGRDVELIYDFDGRNSYFIGYKLLEADNTFSGEGG